MYTSGPAATPLRATFYFGMIPVRFTLSPSDPPSQDESQRPNQGTHRPPYKGGLIGRTLPGVPTDSGELLRQVQEKPN